MEQLADAGFKCFGFDLRGHGNSDGRRGHVNAWQDYHHDLAAVSELMESQFHLFGHSMGGLISLDWAVNNPRITSLVLSSPLLGVAVQAPKWKVMAGKLLSKLLPTLAMNNELPASDICSDPNVVQAYLDDPKVFDTITPRWFTEMSAAMARVHLRAPQYKIPIYLNLAGDDRAVSTTDAEQFFNQLECSKQLKEWPGLFHETLNECNRLEVSKKIIDWLLNQD